MAIKNRKKLLILALLIFNTLFWLSIASKKKAATPHFGTAVWKQTQTATRARTHAHEREREREEMAVGVLALQGSFREHIACEFCFSVFSFYKEIQRKFYFLVVSCFCWSLWNFVASFRNSWVRIIVLEAAHICGKENLSSSNSNGSTDGCNHVLQVSKGVCMGGRSGFK
jgi:hypothetical protein